MRCKSGRLFWVFFFISCTSSAVYASERLSIYAKASGDWIYHGVSETGNNPSVGINVEYQVNSYLVGGISASEGNNEGVRQRHRNITGYLGAEFPINDNWFGAVYLQARRFPSSQIDWDFEELSLSASHRSGFSFRLDVSDDYYATGLSSTAIESQYQYSLFDSYFVIAGLGHFDLDSQLDYEYASIKLGKTYKRYSANIGYHWVGDTILQPTPVGLIQSPKFVIEVLCKCF